MLQKEESTDLSWEAPEAIENLNCKNRNWNSDKTHAKFYHLTHVKYIHPLKRENLQLRS